MPEQTINTEQALMLMQTIGMIGHLALQVDADELSALVDAFGRWDTVGPFLDPTAYRDIGRRSRHNEGFVRAFVAFREAAVKRMEAGDDAS